MKPLAPPLRLGWLPALAVIASLGVLIVALGDVLSRDGKAGGTALFWLGITGIAVPAIVRLVSDSATREERLAIVITFGLSLYLVKVVYDPTGFSFSDEFIHQRSAQDLLESGRLFEFNPLLPVASQYPGMGTVTATLAEVTGLSVSTAGLSVIGAARLILLIASFLIFERLTGSARAAGLACFLYAANPNFLYWSAQFAYESLALPLALVVVFCAFDRPPKEARGFIVMGALVAVGVVVTHHLSAYALSAALTIWLGLALWRRRQGVRTSLWAPSVLGAVVVAGTTLWLLAGAPSTGGYLGRVFGNTGGGLLDVVTGQEGARAIFGGDEGGGPKVEVAPLWERLLSLAAVAILLALLPLAVRHVWRQRRLSPPMVIAVGLALLYPLLLPLRFVASAQETSTRSSEYVFVGIAAVVGAAIASAWLPGRLRRPRQAAVVLGSGVVFLGGIAVAWQYSERLPSEPSGRKVSATPDYQADWAARWTARALGPQRRFVSDQADRLALATSGRQRPLFAPRDGVSSWEVMLPRDVNQSVRRAINRGGVEFALVERRLSAILPADGSYFDKGEPLAGEREEPISPSVLAKFDRSRGADRLYDSGSIQVYDLRRLGR